MGMVINMPFCGNCGRQLPPEARFCPNCGTPAAVIPVQNMQQPPVQPPVQPVPMLTMNDVDTTYYEGREQVFTFRGQEIRVPAEMDVFNHYRKEFNKFAKIQTQALRAEYCSRVTNLDRFLTDFPVMYSFFRQPLLNTAVDLLAEAGLYDISPQQFEEQHTADFCLCGEDVDIMIDSFNKTIEANQERKAQGYNMLPGMVFSGIGGFVTAMAVNVAVNKVAEADIRNANVTPQQRMELYYRINFENLMDRAFTDYWRVFLSMTWQMNRRGLPVWYPNEDANQRASGLFQNLCAGRIPDARVPELVGQMLLLNPYADDRVQYIQQHFGRDEETAAILDYFSA